MGEGEMPTNDMLIGVQEILEAFPALARGVSRPDKRVYWLRRQKGCPIQNRPGLGICVSRSRLEAWLQGEDQPA